MMISLTDTHCHLAEAALVDDLENVIAAAESCGVKRFVVPSAHAGDFAAVGRLADNKRIFAAFGIHPWFAKEVGKQELDGLKNYLVQYPRAWVGETGLDFQRAKTRADREIQTAWFETHLTLAREMQRPIIVHNVKASAAIAAAAKRTGFAQGGIVHAFSGSLEEAALLVKCGFKIGIGSLLLNPNAKKACAAAKSLTLEDIVLETDSPFMLGDLENRPKNVRKIAEIAAELRGISLAELAEQTEKNVNALLAQTSV